LSDKNEEFFNLHLINCRVALAFPLLAEDTFHARHQRVIALSHHRFPDLFTARNETAEENCPGLAKPDIETPVILVSRSINAPQFINP
jgi:hypothetical protein